MPTNLFVQHARSDWQQASSPGCNFPYYIGPLKQHEHSHDANNDH